MQSEQFERLLAQKRLAYVKDPGFRAMSDNQCSSFPVEEFFRPGGMTIGRLALRVGLPVSTLRHYVNLGLIESYRVGGRLRFLPINLWELASLRQWQNFGYSLERIVQRKQLIRQRWPGAIVLDVLGPLTVPPFMGERALVFYSRTTRDGGCYEELRLGKASGDDLADPQDRELLDFVSAELLEALRGLEERLHSLKQAHAGLIGSLEVLSPS